MRNKIDPPVNTPCTLTFRDGMGEYDAGPFVFENGQWVHESKRDLPAQGVIVDWKEIR